MVLTNGTDYWYIAVMLHSCDYCGTEYQRNSFCKSACKTLFHRKGKPADIAPPAPPDIAPAEDTGDKKEIARLNAMLDAALADVARMQSAPLSDAEKIDESKKTKQELQAQIDAIPARREPGPQVKPAYHSDPHYDYERGYDDSAAAIAI